MTVRTRFGPRFAIKQGDRSVSMSSALPCAHAATPRRALPAAFRRLALLLAMVAATVPSAEAGPVAKPKAKPKPAVRFAAFEGAWKARSPATIVGCMEPKGSVLVQLMAYPLSGKARSMKPEQAKATLKAYFKKVSSVKLKDVSPKKSPENVRLYEYTYKPAGENARTTHLRVQLKQDKNRLWVLASLTESAKPRT